MTRATETRQILEATGMDVFIAGDRCAVHFYSREGTTVITMALREFVRKARRDVDGNRRCFPRGEPSPVTPPPSGRGKRGTLPPERLAAYQAARRDSESGKCTVPMAAATYGVEPNTFRSWLRKERAKERAARGEVMPAAAAGQADPAQTKARRKRRTWAEAEAMAARVQAAKAAQPGATQEAIAATLGLKRDQVQYYLSDKCKAAGRRTLEVAA